jgi:ATP-dependent DNA helicase DinG
LRFPHIERPSLVLAGAGAVVAEPVGGTRRLAPGEARRLLAGGEVLVCHAAFLAQRLDTALAKPVFDLLELFAFARPGEACLPSPVGLACALGLGAPQTPEDGARTLPRAAEHLLEGLAALSPEAKAQARATAAAMMKAGWRWGSSVLAVLGEPERLTGPLTGLEAWRELPQWEDEAPPARPLSRPVGIAEAHARLAQLVGRRGRLRPQQQAFATAAVAAFQPRERAGAPRVALVEAGTGTGKTLGYLAPASLWAEANGPGLWISTYTRNLQRQILQEATKLYPDSDERNEKVVIRKGRENYLCLLNFEDAAKRSTLIGGQRAVALGLVARWIQQTPDGDLSGTGFPAFLAASLPLRELTDRRGECIYAACPHYRVCFIERGLRRAKSAVIVIANHALVMAQASWQGVRAEEADDIAPERKVRYVFDEGHHVFDAADSAFAAELTGAEMAELRRWIRGPEGRQSRARGLGERARDLLGDAEAGVAALDEALGAAGALAGEGWLQRIKAGGARGPGEAFLARIYAHVRARSSDADTPYAIEAETRPIAPELADAARALDTALARLAMPLIRIVCALHRRLDSEAATLDENLRVRIEAAARGIERRAQLLIPPWRAMLATLADGEPQSEFADWFEIARDDGRDIDVGLKRHWVDPTIPFAGTILEPAHGALITSATLRDSGAESAGAADAGWRAAEIRAGAHHLAEPPSRALFGSPFDWVQQARVIVVRDVDRRNAERLAAAYRELFVAAGGGALGLFTAVRSLRAAHARLLAPLADRGLTLYAQHVDALDTGTLVDLFRAEENSCLLGTDALRDGVDVPGRSLRLCVFDKVPWPKPTILHRARRERFGRLYDDQIVRLRLKQAFGRLIRSEGDKGVFVILDGACPSRLLAGLPPEAPTLRCGLAEAVAETRRFLSSGHLGWDARATAQEAAP